jgi:3-deoxy-7-phosphoheptulonate synthase
MEAAARPHHFLGINRDGSAAIVSTTGNPDGHLVLRGGKSGTNYHEEAISKASAALAAAGLPSRLMVDCSHGNSNKDYRRQGEVLRDLAAQVRGGGTQVMGGQPDDPRRSHAAHLWPEHHRCLHRSARHHRVAGRAGHGRG